MTATISAKGQLVIPAAIRKRYRLAAHAKVDILDTGHAIVILPAPTGDAFIASKGILKGKLSSKDVLAFRRRERAREAKALG